ncbi:hypothetical protein [Breoghania sp. L-A4]|uniref:hypothetical protein n=1 Tax=Breoghania sp. L-A4 TaxID=2304600 RepID=UPI000E35F354|nr:hypothetical protein [Breoghania sp. L-A4]AXS39340.1 hypothetical protein D1F64_03820 [Breoghania sp. L-A4]
MTRRATASLTVIVAALLACAAQAQVVVPLPVVPRAPSNTDGFLKQRDSLNRLLEDQSRTRDANQDKLREAEQRRKQAERERRRKAPETPYDRPVGSLPSNHP